MRNFLVFALSVSSATAGILLARDDIPTPAPASAYGETPPAPKGKAQPIIPAGPPGGLNTTIIPDDIPVAKPSNNTNVGSFRVAAACSGPVTSNPSTFWMDQMDHTGNARGYAPFLANYYTFPTYRNVLAYGAKNDGSGDSAPAIQKALNDDGRGGNRWSSGVVTAMPAHVFLPGGTYTLNTQLDLRLGTIIMGDPQNPPILKAAAGFSGSTLIRGYDSAAGQPETSFMTALKNVVIDTTALDPAKQITALQWGVAQGCAIGNVKINMPSNSDGHIGMNLAGGSTIAVTDMQITGGAIGIQNSNQQVNFKNIYFKFCRTAYGATGGFTSLLQNVVFETCGLGIDLSQGNHGNVVLLDSNSINSGPTVKFTESSASGARNNQVVIQNLKHDTTNPIAINSNGDTKLAAASSVDTWVWGNYVPGGFVYGQSYTTTRSPALVDSSGKYVNKNAPTYAGYALDQFVNVKAVDGYPVKGDGATDDSASLNAILAQAAANCKIVYFPYGVYVVKSTLFVPAGTRMVGEAWAVISGAGSVFKDASNPQPIVKVGNPGDVGVAQISDMRFTVAEPLPGAIIVQVNIAGGSPGDVGIWDTQVNIGGMADSTVHTSCTNQDTTSCMAAFLAVHLTASSSAYLQNIWVWTADHNLDGGPIQIISTGRGVLVESTKATWLVGTGSEHHWLYNYNFNNAQNVFAGLLQTESPYMQGNGAVKLAPAPWVAVAKYGDPDFSWCGGGDGRCRTALGQNINGGSNLFLHNTASWAFFDGPWTGDYGTQCSGNCQTNMLRISGVPSHLYWYGIGTKSADTMVFDSRSNPQTFNNPGGWGGNIAAYREFA
ncbi:putative exo-beta-1,3-glucanase [Phlyctema vagabunda]|uniref:Exo-beta-1,3-glucanase n=1 Tax=Phlyctema vagabunda TaxID=108571 RepID=A0ABR4PYB8_9HELO